jgi:hypothetical protein
MTFIVRIFVDEGGAISGVVERSEQAGRSPFTPSRTSVASSRRWRRLHDRRADVNRRLFEEELDEDVAVAHPDGDLVTDPIT